MKAEVQRLVAGVLVDEESKKPSLKVLMSFENVVGSRNKCK